MDHSDDAACSGSPDDGDLGRQRRSAFAPLTLDITEAAGWFPHGDFTRGGSLGAEVENNLGADMSVDLCLDVPGGNAWPRGNCLPNLLGRARYDRLDLYPAFAGFAFLMGIGHPFSCWRRVAPGRRRPRAGAASRPALRHRARIRRGDRSSNINYFSRQSLRG
jgi:hypothetical protein